MGEKEEEEERGKQGDKTRSRTTDKKRVSGGGGGDYSGSQPESISQQTEGESGGRRFTDSVF